MLVQGALWKILNNIIPSFIPSSYHSGINAFCSEASGKDVVRNGDILEWVSPQAGNNTIIVAGHGETVTLVARIGHLENGDWVARSGVKVLFSATGGDSLDKTFDWTNSSGMVEVQVTIPDGAGSVEVKASTKGLWPQKYLDLSGNQQDLIGIGTTYELTVSTSMFIIAYIHVVPEVPLGTLTVIATCFAAYILKTRKVS
jgi:hypothetical protein